MSAYEIVAPVNIITRNIIHAYMQCALGQRQPQCAQLIALRLHNGLLFLAVAPSSVEQGLTS